MAKRKGPRPAIRGIAELLYETTPEGRQRHIMTVRGLVSLGNFVPARENQDYTFMTAVYALDAFLGTDWVIKHISQPGKPGFLRAPPSDRKRQHICALRIIWLAEMLFNFQRAAGLDDILAKLGDGQLEDTYAELEVGKLLALYGVAFKFRKPDGTPGGRNYDLEFFHPNGELVCGETKCKLEKTKLSDSGITTRLDKARDQLPPNGPGMIFLKVPQPWMDTSGFRDRFTPLALNRLRTSSRLVAIATWTSHIELSGIGGPIKHGLVGREEIKPNLTDGRNWRMFTRYEQPDSINPPGWASLPELVPQAGFANEQTD